MNTREHIIDTFSMLVSKYGYEQVNATMIIKEANVGRTTFYRYFKDKEDVLESHYHRIYDEALQNCTNFRDLAQSILERVKENSYEASMYSTFTQTPYREFVYKYMYSRGKSIIEKVWRRKLTEIEEFHLSFFCAGGARITEEYALKKKYLTMSAKDCADEIMKMSDERYFVTFTDKEKE